MKLKEAITAARSYLEEVFQGEDIADVRLEEVVFDRRDDAWLITFGVMRPSGTSRPITSSIFTPATLKQSYKVVRIPTDSNDLPSVRIREFAED